MIHVSVACDLSTRARILGYSGDALLAAAREVTKRPLRALDDLNGERDLPATWEIMKKTRSQLWSTERKPVTEGQRSATKRKGGLVRSSKRVKGAMGVK